VISALQNLPQASHLSVGFPITRQSVKGSGRQHIHEFPHAPGGQPEKLGRKLYVIKMQALFFDSFKTIPDLYSNRLQQLVAQWEKQTTGTLVVPTIGQIQAFCTEWPREADFAKILSGETLELEFVEDPPASIQDFFFNGGRDTAQACLDRAVQIAPQYPTIPMNLLQSLQAAIGQVTALVTSVSMIGQSLANQVNGIIALFQQLDAGASMQNPQNYPVLDQVLSAWAAMSQFQQSLTTKQGTPQTFTVPVTMSISQVSVAIFGNTGAAVTLMQMNALDDALSIPAGTPITYLR
jgi:prophage DNA circulation protein